jgi:hypothetical protein
MKHLWLVEWEGVNPEVRSSQEEAETLAKSFYKLAAYRITRVPLPPVSERGKWVKRSPAEERS